MAGKNNYYCYSDSETLINIPGIKNQKELFELERELVSYRLAELNEKPIKGSFELDYLKKIHAYLFQDIYDWAGEIRICNISKSGILFCASEYILSYAASIFDPLKAKNFFVEYDYEQKLNNLVDLFASINALHPFREGNGRSQRLYIEWLAKINGIRLDLTKVSRPDMIYASYEGMKCNYKYLYNLFKDHSYSLSRNVQLNNIEILLDAQTKKTVLNSLGEGPQKRLKL